MKRSLPDFDPLSLVLAQLRRFRRIFGLADAGSGTSIVARGFDSRGGV
jgi:hypothetical protein